MTIIRNGTPGQYAAAADLSGLGLPTDLIASGAQGLDPLTLQLLHERYESALLGGSAHALGGCCAACHYPSPAAMLELQRMLCGSGYSGGGTPTGEKMKFDFAPHVKNGWWQRTFNPERRHAAKLERALQNNDMLREQFEASVGGKIVGWGDKGRADGVFEIQRFAPGDRPLPLIAQNPSAATIYSMLGGMDAAILQQAALVNSLGGGYGGYGGDAMFTGGLGGDGGSILPSILAGVGTGVLTGALTKSPLWGLLGGGAAALLTSMFTGGGGLGGLGGPGQTWGGNLGQLPFDWNLVGPAGYGSWNPLAMPGQIQGTNPVHERAHQAQVASILNDPSLSVEDKVMMMLALIMKKMDDDIDRQMQYINALQNQQANKDKKSSKMGGIGGIAGGIFGGAPGAAIGSSIGGKVGGGGKSSPSVDVEMQKLQRMITKRAQIFEMASNIMKKYDDTARAAIQKMSN